MVKVSRKRSRSKQRQSGGKPCCAQRGGNSQCGRQRGAGKKQKGGHSNRR